MIKARIDDIEIGSDGATGAHCDVVVVRWKDETGVWYSRHPAPYCHTCGMRAVRGTDGCLEHDGQLIPLDTSEYDDLIVHDCD